MKITKTEEMKKVLKEGGDRLKRGDYEVKVVNIIIGHPDHKGRTRHHTEDELRKMKINIDEVIVEMDK